MSIVIPYNAYSADVTDETTTASDEGTAINPPANDEGGNNNLSGNNENINNLLGFSISVGATIWDTSLARKYSLGPDGAKMRDTCDKAFLYGPAMSVKFNNDFNLTFVFLYGTFDNSGEPAIEFNRKDSDLALNYRLNDYFKVFGGIKYIGISKSAEPPFYDYTYESENNGFGPGLGLSASLPFTENIYLLTTLSVFYLWGKESVTVYDTGSTTSNYNFNAYGINATISLAYYIANASTTISLGKRFQSFKTKYKDDVYIDTTPSYYNSMKYKFYGTTLTATYSFDM